MPYINQQQRNEVDWYIAQLANAMDEEAGTFNYVVTRLIQLVLHRKPLRYKTINKVMGVLECIKNEYYRKVAEPYENQKCMENGDVYD